MAGLQSVDQEQESTCFYSPLIDKQNQIRLFFLDVDDHTQHDNPISGRLAPWALDHIKGRYVALSYVWDDTDAAESISISGASFSVTSNLLGFLKAHRRRCQNTPGIRRLPLWIDSICIDQDDIEERNSQLMLMKSIYQNAGMVISWLGTSFPLSDWTFKVLKGFKKQIERAHGLDVSKVSDVSWLGSCAMVCKQDSSDGLLKSVVWDSIRELCGHIYWRRIWTFQEVILGNAVMVTCGDDAISLKDIINVIRWLTGLNPSLKKPDNMEIAIWNMISSREFSERVIGLQSILRVCAAREGKSTQGWAMMNMLRDYEASDPRDKVYGGLGITGLHIVPDYSKSVRDVYVEAATALMHERFELVLTMSGLSDMSSGQESWGIPSWAPDWRHSTPGSYSSGHSFVASRSSPTVPAPTVAGYSLFCSGVVCDEIIAVEPTLEPRDCLNFCCQYITSRETAKYPSGIPHLRALFQVLLSDWDTMVNCRTEPESMIFQVVACGLLHVFLDGEIQYRNRMGRAQIANPLLTLGLGPQKSDLATTFWEQVVGTYQQPDSCVITGPREEQSAAMNAIGERLSASVLAGLTAALKDRRIFHTRSGYMGMGIGSAQVGDQVCVAYDCNLPILLRPRGPYNTHIGACYVVGFMDGEAMVDVRNGKRQTQTFEIR